MSSKKSRYNLEYDLSNCDAEPLRFIRSCQSHACLLVLYRDTLRIKACSENVFERFGITAAELLGRKLAEVLTEETVGIVAKLDNNEDALRANPIVHRYAGKDQVLRQENVIAHFNEDYLILELEARENGIYRSEFLLEIDLALQRIQAIATENTVLDTTAREIKRLTGYDRVLIYRFDEEYNGEVVAESREPELSAFLHLRYPHTDIPKQARELYLRQHLRQIVSSAKDAESLILSDDEELIDLSLAVNRGVSPIHLEYLRTMGTGASISIAVVVNQRLWGLLACHHRTEKLVDYRLRTVLGLFARVVAGHLAMHQSTAFREGVLQTELTRSRLVERMYESPNLLDALLAQDSKLLQLVDATGAIIRLNGEYHHLGDCPTQSESEQLFDFLDERDQNYWSSDSLYEDFPPSSTFRNAPAGLLAIRFTKSPGEYLVWLRPELIRTINWGGRPKDRKVVTNGKVRLSPTLSFAKYSESKRGTSQSWERHQLDAALALRNDIKDVLLLKFQEIRKLNGQLNLANEELESFSYSVSHDLRAPLRSIKGYAEILQEDYQEQLDDYGRSALNVIVDNVGKMNSFINDILEFSRLGRTQLVHDQIALPDLIHSIWEELGGEFSPVSLQLELEGTAISGDHTHLWQLFQNLLSNALKYRRNLPDSWVKVSARRDEDHTLIEVADNGIGFAMKHADRIFAVFERLVPESQYEGTGVGLAIARRIIEKHNGTISVNSSPGEGTQFLIRLPRNVSATAD